MNKKNIIIGFLVVLCVILGFLYIRSLSEYYVPAENYCKYEEKIYNISQEEVVFFQKDGSVERKKVLAGRTVYLNPDPAYRHLQSMDLFYNSICLISQGEMKCFAAPEFPFYYVDFENKMIGGLDAEDLVFE